MKLKLFISSVAVLALIVILQDRQGTIQIMTDNDLDISKNAILKDLSVLKSKPTFESDVNVHHDGNSLATGVVDDRSPQGSEIFSGYASWSETHNYIKPAQIDDTRFNRYVGYMLNGVPDSSVTSIKKFFDSDTVTTAEISGEHLVHHGHGLLVADTPPIDLSQWFQSGTEALGCYFNGIYVTEGATYIYIMKNQNTSWIGQCSCKDGKCGHADAEYIF